MKNSVPLLALALALRFPALAQHDSPDGAPSAKYLLRICTWDLKETTVHCDDPSKQLPPARAPQWIEFKQVASPGSPAGTEPPYPLQINGSFFVSAKASSGLPVTITVLAGSVTAETSTTLAAGTMQYRVNGPGTVVLKAERGGDGYYDGAAPVTLVFDAGPMTDHSCGGLLPAPGSPRVIPTIDAAAIARLLGEPQPYALAAAGPHTILVYAAREVPKAEHPKTLKSDKAAKPAKPAKPAKKDDESADSEAQHKEDLDVLNGLEKQIQTLLDRNADTLGLPERHPFSVELEIPHSRAMGDLAKHIASLNYSELTVEDVGDHRIRVIAPIAPDCARWSAFLHDLRDLAWQPKPEPWNARLFYLGQNTGANGATQTGATDLAAAYKASATAASDPPAGKPAEASSDSTDDKKDKKEKPAAPPAGAPPPSAAAMAPLENDLLLFSTQNPGDDENIAEQKRIIAQLDLPRPEMIINGWVLQNSTTSPRAIGAFASAVKELAGSYNQSLETVVQRAWGYVRAQIAAGNFFDDAFYRYIADRYVGGRQHAIDGKDPQTAAQQYLDSTRATLTFPGGTSAADYGICTPPHYCLGYTTLFQPLKPRLTDVLLALIAARDPEKAVYDTTRVVEGNATATSPNFCDALAEDKDRCKKIWNSLDLTADEKTCESQDLHLILGSTFKPGQGDPPARVFLRCFLTEAENLLKGGVAGDAKSSPSGAGLMRAAVANFLFNYKMSQQFPHEFKAYDLSQSADALNSAWSPLIDAFNRDVTTFQRFVRADVLYQVERINRNNDDRCCIKRLLGLDKPSFFNEGIVTVRTISGQWTYASSTSQSFLNASSAPKLTDVLNSLTGAGTNTTSGETAPVSAVLPGSGALSSAQLAAAFLNNYQTTYAQIGRQLAISAIPRSLATASAAEIVVSLNADDSASPPIYAGGQQNGAAANTSRVANHDTSTRVRVDSMKLFEVSSFAAVLQRSRSRIPLVPPLVEIPYIGTLVGIPVPPAKEYHQSTALLSALVVPTAADIAYGLQFQFDQTAEGPKEICTLLKGASGDDRCRLRRLVSFTDFGERNPVDLYNRAMVHCLATDMRAVYSSINGFTPAGASACANLSFDTLPY
ncbi:MAG TPA: hypothetical protein VMT86_10405 [Bryobacteraceae bacterium]|nr:hypothetical protein [Bryobacteraceae bacterium]